MRAVVVPLALQVITAGVLALLKAGYRPQADVARHVMFYLLLLGLFLPPILVIRGVARSRTSLGTKVIVIALEAVWIVGACRLLLP